MKSKLFLSLLLLATAARSWAGFVFTTDTNTQLTTIRFTNNFYDGVCSVEGRSGARWVAIESFFVTNRIGQFTLSLPTNFRQFRLVSQSVAPGNANPRLAANYNFISTIAGRGPVPAGTNAWLPEYEGAQATNVPLSNPVAAMGDSAGNVYVVDKGSHALMAIRPNGTIQTIVGTHAPGSNGDTPFPEDRLSSPLNSPSAVWVSSNAVYVLDAGNSRVRQVVGDFVFNLFNDTSGIETNGPGMTPDAAGLWVAPDLSEALYCDGTVLKKWDREDGVSVVATGFIKLTGVTVDPEDRIIVCDAGDNRLYRVRGNGRKTPFAGDGFLRNFQLGGRVNRVSLPGASSVWFLPIGGYLVSLDAGARVWYVDADDNAAPFVFGKPGAHSGDGKWFRAPGQKISNVRHVSLTPAGDIILVEGNGYIRHIEFERRIP